VAQESPETNARRFALRACGEDVQIYSRAHIVSPEVISIGDSVVIDDFVFLVGGVETRIGSFVHLASFTSYLGRGRLEIGDFVSVSSGARLYTGIDDFSGESLVGPGVPEPFRQPIRSFLTVGKYALIGANAVVFPGVTLGEGCAIGALSLVKSDCEPWTIYAGTPARPVRERRRDRIEQLEKELRATLYDGAGRYIPRRSRKP
jgi:acetyltransferase-like isoleucine patch superfamily enzyme